MYCFECAKGRSLGIDSRPLVDIVILHIVDDPTFLAALMKMPFSSEAYRLSEKQLTLSRTPVLRWICYFLLDHYVECNVDFKVDVWLLVFLATSMPNATVGASSTKPDAKFPLSVAQMSFLWRRHSCRTPSSLQMHQHAPGLHAPNLLAGGNLHGWHKMRQDLFHNPQPKFTPHWFVLLEIFSQNSSAMTFSPALRPRFTFATALFEERLGG